MDHLPISVWTFVPRGHHGKGYVTVELSNIVRRISVVFDIFGMLPSPATITLPNEDYNVGMLEVGFDKQSLIVSKLSLLTLSDGVGFFVFS